MKKSVLATLLLAALTTLNVQADSRFITTTVSNGSLASNTVWYTIQIAANGYVVGNNGSGSYIALDNVISDITDDSQLWAFTGDDANGYKLYNKEAGAGKVLAAPTSMSGVTGSASYPILVNANGVPSGYTDTWMFAASGDLGGKSTHCYMYERGFESNKVNNRDGRLAFWNEGADAGSTLNIRLASAAEYAINASQGSWSDLNSGKTWAATWTSTAAPKVVLAQQDKKCNMAAYNNTSDIQLFTCLKDAAVNGVYSSVYTISAEEGYVITGYRFKFTSSGGSDVTVTPDGQAGITASSSTWQQVSVSGKEERTLSFTVSAGSNMFANTSEFYVTAERSKSITKESKEIFTTLKGETPYRIPAIAKAKNGNLIAVADYRHSGSDIGVVNNGRIDLLARISGNNGQTWGDRFAIIEGKGANSPDFMNVGFGDPCIAADRESDRVLVLSCAGNVSFQNGSRSNHQNIARFYSDNNGTTWSAPVDIAESIYSQFDNSRAHGPAMAMFIGSGKIHQSRFVKASSYYRLYCAVLLKNRQGTYTNFVLYSDDFGGSWSVLGGVETAPIPNDADEPKVDELPDGNVIISSRCDGGRHFNIFTFTNAERAEGSWGTRATSNGSVNGIVPLSNSTNGEILILPAVRKADNKEVHIALHSIPFGSGRNNVGIYYKELADKSDYSTPAAFAKDWDGRYQVSSLPSAYSTMCVQADNTIAFLYEESTHNADYTIVYKNYTLEDITGKRYSLQGEGETPEPEPEPEPEPQDWYSTVAKPTFAGGGNTMAISSLKLNNETVEAAYTAGTTSCTAAPLAVEAGKTYSLSVEYTINWGEISMFIIDKNGTEQKYGHYTCAWEPNGDPLTIFKRENTDIICEAFGIDGIDSLIEDSKITLPYRVTIDGGLQEGDFVVVRLLIGKADAKNGADDLNIAEGGCLDVLFEVQSTETGIDEPKDENVRVKAVYDLSGRKVENPIKGIYIIDGKAVMINKP
ncbi:MAG: exo-alpha-sialidase [Bacteroidaceae bacterium]|nr:exo-alpha-sialidase [Bacteroidaceae bacterium]